MIDLERLARAQQSLVEAGRVLHGAGKVPATGGNFSVRLDDKHMAVTASGRHKGFLTPADIMVTDFACHPVGSTLKPSDEARLHGQLYEDFPEAEAILHTHSRPSTLLSLLTTGSEVVVTGYELQKALEGISTHEARVVIPVFDNTQDIAALAQVAHARLAGTESCAYLIRGHGIYTWARDMNACLRHVEALDFLFDCELEMRRHR
ncbi:methylthioribulose 1-phosphate dehydratase [Phytohalomonas tamaricis]|uniref:methylthioribulose 1-phosphate dehydratase n=1 Tax=Phytohalomonas tamaricis TaxID=2081032 RepID=UPI000D0B5681|nr:methylthioribulose 1-phosphate dehydratase [Phytohalomonas tamaricis]